MLIQSKHVVLVSSFTSALLLVGVDPACVKAQGISQVHDTARLLEAGKYQIGIWDLAWAPTTWMQTQSHNVWWFAGGPNVSLKFQPIDLEHTQLSVTVGLLYNSLHWLQTFNIDTDAKMWVLPFTLSVSHELSNEHTATASVGYTLVQLSGRYNPEDVYGVAAIDNLKVQAIWDWSFLQRVAFRISSYVVFNQNTEAELQLDDPNSGVSLHLWTESSLLDQVRWGIIPSVVIDWGSFYTRLGMGIGNLLLPVANFAWPNITPIPEIDIFARF